MTTSTTSTTDNTLDLTRDTLTLVVVSPDYFATGEQHHLMPNGDDDSRTYYATASRILGEEWAAILVDWDTDPRGQIGWHAGEEYADLVNPDTHGGWNIRREYLTPVTTTTTTDRTPPTSAAMSQQDRVALPIEEAYPMGSRWTHTPSSVTVTVTGHRDDRVEVTRDDGVPSGWNRLALDEYGAFVGWAEDASQEATSAPETAEETAPEVFTREDVDRLVQEAREAARREADAALEEFKEAANARAIEYAESNGLCSEFERCMADIGLMGREEWREAHQLDYAVEFVVRVDVSASNEDDAEERAREELYESLSWPLDQNIQHYSTREV